MVWIVRQEASCGGAGLNDRIICSPYPVPDMEAAQVLRCVFHRVQSRWVGRDRQRRDGGRRRRRGGLPPSPSPRQEVAAPAYRHHTCPRQCEAPLPCGSFGSSPPWDTILPPPEDHWQDVGPEPWSLKQETYKVGVWEVVGLTDAAQGFLGRSYAPAVFQ